MANFLPKRHSSSGPPVTVASGVIHTFVLTALQLEHENFRLTVVGSNGAFFASAPAGVAGSGGSDEVDTDDTYVFGGEGFEFKRRPQDREVCVLNEGPGNIMLRLNPFL